MARKIKKTKVKGKPTSVTQKVIVNVSKGGGRSRQSRASLGSKPSGPQSSLSSLVPPPSQAQQLLMGIAPLLAQRQPLVQTSQPLQSSQQQLQTLENILKQLIPKEGPTGPAGPAGPKGEKGEPAPIFYYDPNASIRTPSLSSSDSRSSLDSFAFDFSELGRPYVLDQPDAPLVEPAKPLVSSEPIRLDPPHEDVPLEAIGEEEKVNVSKWDIFDDNNKVSLEKLEDLPVIRKASTSYLKPTLREIASDLRITIPRGATKKGYIDQIVKFFISK